MASILKIMLLLLMLQCNKLSAQNSKIYIDSIDRYKKEVDSLVDAFYNIPPSNINRVIAHYYCIGKEGGGYAELYRNSNGQFIMLTWQSTCDSLYNDKVYYFIDNKIVLKTGGGLSESRNERKYYKNDMFVSKNGVWFAGPILDDKDLAKGYDVLKGLTK